MRHQWFNCHFMKLRENCAQRNKNNDFIQHSSPLRVILAPLVYVQIKARACVVILPKMAPWWSEGDELLNKVIIFVFFAHKKYSLSFVKIHWSTGVTWIILTMSLLCSWALIVVGPLLSMQGQKLSDFIKNILICVLMMNEGLMGLEQHEGW